METMIHTTFSRLAAIFAFTVLFGGCVMLQVNGADAKLAGDHFDSGQGDIVVHPVNHASLVIAWNDKVIYVDPVGAGRFKGLPKPSLILLTDIHGDHLNDETLKAVSQAGTKIVAPEAVTQKLDSELRAKTTTLHNGQSQTISGLKIEAIPMYNLTPDRLKFHTKGRGNGYVLTTGGKRFYISGDSEDIPEMRALQNIDVAFVCMNLPYTMTVEQAADAVRAFKPKVVYPYHYRGSDLEKFKSLVGSNQGIEVRLRDWYQN